MSCGDQVTAGESGACGSSGGSCCSGCESSSVAHAGANTNAPQPATVITAPFIPPPGNEGAASTYTPPHFGGTDTSFAASFIPPPGNEGALSNYGDSFGSPVPNAPPIAAPGASFATGPYSSPLDATVGAGLSTSTPWGGPGAPTQQAFNIGLPQLFGSSGGSGGGPAGEVAAYSREPSGTYGVQCRTTLRCSGPLCRQLGCHQDLSNCREGTGYPQPRLESPGPWLYCVSGKTDVIYPTRGPNALPADWAWFTAQERWEVSQMTNEGTWNAGGDGTGGARPFDRHAVVDLSRPPPIPPAGVPVIRGSNLPITEINDLPV